MADTKATDGPGATGCLRVLTARFANSPFPGSLNVLKATVEAEIRKNPPWLIQWERSLPAVRRLSKKPTRRSKSIVERFVAQWKLQQVLQISKKGSKCVWNMKRIAVMLELEKSPQESAPSSAPSGASQTSDTPGRLDFCAYAPMDEKRMELVETAQRLTEILAADQDMSGDANAVVAVDCEGVPEALHLVQVATKTDVYVIDCLKLGPEAVCSALSDLLTSGTTTKLFHDLHQDAFAFARIGGVPLRGCLDSQLAVEELTGHLHIGFNGMLEYLGQEHHPSKAAVKKRMVDGWGGSLFARRPLPLELFRYAAMDASLLLASYGELKMRLGERLNGVQLASDERALHAISGGLRRVCVDVGRNYALASRELVETCRPASMQAFTPHAVSNEVGSLLECLPVDIAGGLDDQALQVRDIVMDKGRRPYAWCAGERVFLGAEGRTVTAADIDFVVGEIHRVGHCGFGHDNRAGLEAQLHRISAIRNRAKKIIGLTMRVGRFVTGNASMISDLLLNGNASILFLGEPGGGKTTIIRDVARVLAEKSNVVIVDTSQEIAGDGDVPHPCVGLARRLQVCSLSEQSNVMLEAVQNHTPDVIVVDEVGRPAEVEAVHTCKQRGVRMVASAHGSLRTLLANGQLRGLVGGVDSVTLGDAHAEKLAASRGSPPGAIDKIKKQRAGPPIFEVVVELFREKPDEWLVVSDAAKAVDAILEGSQYIAQRRTRKPSTGELFLELGVRA